MTKNLKVQKTGNDGIQINANFEVEGFGEFQANIQYKKLPEAMRDLLDTRYEELASKVNAADGISIELFKAVAEFIMVVSSEVEAALAK